MAQNFSNNNQPKQDWVAQRGQQLPFLVPLQVKEVLLTGNRGGGKSDCLLVSFLRGVGRGWGPNWSGYLFKRTVPEVLPLFEKAKALYGANCPAIKFTQHPYCKFVWPGGEFLTLRHMLDVDDYADLHGSGVTQIMWEELTNWPTSEVYLRCMSLLRSSHSEASKMMQVWSSTNPGQVGHCQPHGQVLTANRGWVEISEMTVEDTVITVDAKGTAKISAITDVVKLPYSGPMVVREGRGIHMEFTPNHRLPLQTKTGFELRPYNTLPGQAMIKRCADAWEGEELKEFTVPPVKKDRSFLDQPDRLSGLDYAELMGWFLSEGCAVAIHNSFEIAQMKAQHKEKIRELFTRCGFKFREYSDRFVVKSKKWYTYFKQFGKCRDKFIPANLKHSGTKTLRVLLSSLMDGDGCRNIYYTTSKQLADDVCDISVKLGYRVYLSSRQRVDREGLSYCVSLGQPAHTELLTGKHVYDVSTTCKKSNIKTYDFSGMVYCLTVPETETFFIRQNGCVWLSGNTWVKKRWKLPEMTNQIIQEGIGDDNEELSRWSKDPMVNIAPRPRIAIFIDVRKNDAFMQANPTYLADMAREAPNDATRRAWIDGSWDIISGGRFDHVWDRKHHVVKPFSIPRGWKIDRSHDAGSSTPFAVLWYAESDGSDYRDGDGNWRSSVRGDIFVIYEWYGTTGNANQGLKLQPQQISKGIIERELIEWQIYQRVVPGPADNAIHTETIAGINVAAMMAETVRLDDGREFPGVQWTRSDKNAGARVTGWNLIEQYLANALPDPKALAPREKPGLFLFERCKYLVDQLPVSPRDDKNVEDLPKRGEFHLADTLRYRILDSGREMSQGSVIGLH